MAHLNIIVAYHSGKVDLDKFFKNKKFKKLDEIFFEKFDLVAIWNFE